MCKSSMESIREIIKQRDLKRVKSYFEKGYDVNKRYGNGETALIIACEYQSKDIVEYLLSIGAKTSIKENGGYTAESVAYWHGEIRMGCYSKDCRDIVKLLKRANG